MYLLIKNMMNVVLICGPILLTAPYIYLQTSFPIEIFTFSLN